MMMQSMTDQIQRYATTITMISASVIAASIVGVAGMLWAMSGDIQSLQTDMQWVKQSVSNVYTQSDAERDLKPIRIRIRDHEMRIRELEQE